MIDCSILNRLRGTGLIKYFGTVMLLNKSIDIKLVWNHIYALYLAILLGVVFSFWVGILVFIMYLLGESKGWGEWVGSLTRYEPWDKPLLEKQYLDDEGKTFPFIHQITNFFIKEKGTKDFKYNLQQYLKYSTLALTLRGMYWWGLVYGSIALLGYISTPVALINTLILGVSFPLACYIGKHIKLSGKIGIINYSRGWENQELVYGLFQGIVLWSTILMYSNN